MKFLGTAVRRALPKSVKSSRRTVTFSEGAYPKSLRSKAQGVLETASGVGSEVGLRGVEIDEAKIPGLEGGELGVGGGG